MRPTYYDELERRVTLLEQKGERPVTVPADSPLGRLWAVQRRERAVIDAAEAALEDDFLETQVWAAVAALRAARIAATNTVDSDDRDQRGVRNAQEQAGERPAPATTPTARGSMPTRADFARAFLADWQTDGFNDYRLADAALNLIAPHVAALERERDEARAAQLEAEKALCDRALDAEILSAAEFREARATARRAEEENARLRERVKSADRLREIGVTKHKWHDQNCTPEQCEYCAAVRDYDSLAAPPPSASAGTGTISDEWLAKQLVVAHLPLVETNTTIEHNWKKVWPLSGQEAWLRVARRAKELLGGSKAVMLPDLDGSERQPGEDLNKWLMRAQRTHTKSWNDAILAVRAALAGRGET